MILQCNGPLNLIDSTSLMQQGCEGRKKHLACHEIQEVWWQPEEGEGGEKVDTYSVDTYSAAWLPKRNHCNILSPPW